MKLCADDRRGGQPLQYGYRKKSTSRLSKKAMQIKEAARLISRLEAMETKISIIASKGR